ncbi:uncharacterized protein LOC112556586 [Pomacea canaliculata]|uniref:uncharacterized protein LOC112556586 n=1 Tax=Pomacea canaliculata TaxID=400727 RepID=UPI000D72EFAF|nr:uncharacterized protein LOC112556586 [Pomacea canaliculata]XP_025081522.1 uncharacterized protein LOC112556586 [Pomacea canaliculata]
MGTGTRKAAVLVETSGVSGEVRQAGCSTGMPGTDIGRCNEPHCRTIQLLEHYTVARLSNFDCYVNIADEDLMTIGRDIIDTLEGVYGLRLCLTLRDVTLGGFEFENMATMLETRCNSKVLIILSKYYEQSDACQFLTQFAVTLDPGARRNKLIPVLVDENVSIPRVLRCWQCSTTTATSDWDSSGLDCMRQSGSDVMSDSPSVGSSPAPRHRLLLSCYLCVTFFGKQFLIRRHGAPDLYLGERYTWHVTSALPHAARD